MFKGKFTPDAIEVPASIVIVPKGAEIGFAGLLRSTIIVTADPEELIEAGANKLVF